MLPRSLRPAGTLLVMSAPAMRDPFSQLEVKLTASFQERPWQQAFQLWDYPETADRQPSVLMEACMTCCRLFLSLFQNSSRLSPSPLRGAPRRGRLLWDSISIRSNADTASMAGTAWTTTRSRCTFPGPLWLDEKQAPIKCHRWPDIHTWLLRKSEDFLEDTGVTVSVLPRPGAVAISSSALEGVADG